MPPQIGGAGAGGRLRKKRKEGGKGKRKPRRPKKNGRGKTESAHPFALASLRTRGRKGRRKERKKAFVPEGGREGKGEKIKNTLHPSLGPPPIFF